jgi:non-heme chloroperoxidase
LSAGGELMHHCAGNPIGAAAMMSSKIVKNATLKVYKDAPHGMCTTRKGQVNHDLLAFLKS